MTTEALAAPKEEAKEETKKAAKAKKGEWDPSLPLRGFGKLTPEEYIKERLNPEIKYYSKSATKSKQSYLRMRALSVIGGALVPVLVNIPGPYVDILTTILSLIVVLIVSLETVYRYREQWTNYRTAEQSLRNQYFQYTSKAGIYGTLDEATAFKLFVDRVEEAIDAESSATLRVMTTLTESKAVPGTPVQAENATSLQVTTTSTESRAVVFTPGQPAELKPGQTDTTDTTAG